jgi:hypothetical protein
MIGKAKQIPVKEFRWGPMGEARLYKLDPPYPRVKWEYEDSGETKEKTIPTEFVVVSAVSHFTTETYIFPSNDEGDIIDWGELEGSFQGGCDHERALQGMGYEVLA